MEKSLLEKRLAELDATSQQYLANYNAILGAKGEIQLLMSQLDALEQKELSDKLVESYELCNVSCETLKDCDSKKDSNFESSENVSNGN